MASARQLATISAGCWQIFYTKFWRLVSQRHSYWDMVQSHRTWCMPYLYTKTAITESTNTSLIFPNATLNLFLSILVAFNLHVACEFRNLDKAEARKDLIIEYCTSFIFFNFYEMIIARAVKALHEAHLHELNMLGCVLQCEVRIHMFAHATCSSAVFRASLFPMASAGRRPALVSTANACRSNYKNCTLMPLFEQLAYTKSWHNTDIKVQIFCKATY